MPWNISISQIEQYPEESVFRIVYFYISLVIFTLSCMQV